MEQYLEQFNKQPMAVRAGTIVAVLALVTGLNWYLVIDDLDSKIRSKQSQIKVQQADLAEKTAAANNLNELIREMEQLETKLAEALTELPEGKDIDELLGQFHEKARTGGLALETVEPMREAPDPSATFVSALPVKMKVTGNYHEVALFLQEVSNLRRIVNVSNLKLTKPELRNDKVVVGTEFVATAYRFVPGAEAAAASSKKKAK